MLGSSWGTSLSYTARTFASTTRRTSCTAAGQLTASHTQASAAYPENTLASFEAAIRDGAEGIESGERSDSTVCTVASTRLQPTKCYGGLALLRDARIAGLIVSHTRPLGVPCCQAVTIVPELAH